jgi:acyl carrier protein
MKTDFKLKNLLPYLLIVFLGSWFLRNAEKSKDDLGQRDSVIEALNSELITWKDENNLQKAKIKVIEAEKASLFLDLKVRDTLIKDLQIEVKRNKDKIKDKGSVTIFNTVTEFDTIIKVVRVDGTKVYDTQSCVFSQTINTEFLDATYGLDSTDHAFLTLKTYDKYSLVIGEEKAGFLKKKTYAEITNHNPFTQTKTLKTYQTQQKKKHFSVGPNISLGLGNDLVIRPYVGFGVQYSMFEF